MVFGILTSKALITIVQSNPGVAWWGKERDAIAHQLGSYGAFGIFGQMIYINPQTKVVIAQFAAWPQAGSKTLSAERAAFIAAVEEGLENNE